jgi:serine/threonine protein kinase
VANEEQKPEPQKQPEPVADKTPASNPSSSDQPSTGRGKRVTVQMPATIKGLTPPVSQEATLIQSQEATLIQSPAPLNTPKPHPSKIHSSTTLQTPIFGRGTGKRSATLPVERMNLSDERILRDAPRVDWEGKSVPALGGIPMLAKLGQGGMGAVYFGVHPRLGSQVAVKVLPFHLADQDPTLIDRFVREAQIAAQVRSPNLVHVIDVNQDSGLWFLVMEYVSGLTGGRLLARLRDEDKMGMTELHACEAIIGACIGLQAAHAMGVIHRDIKPDNIMVPALPDGNLDYPNAKLMDLGLARRTDDAGKSGLTTTQAAMGTPGYMAPEQALEAKNADQRSDIFSMGATIYALMTGKSPFHRESPMKAIFATVHEAHPPLTSVRPDLSPEFSAVVDRCMAKDPAQRYASAVALIEDMSKCRDALVKKTGVSIGTPPPAAGTHEAAGSTQIGIPPRTPSGPPAPAASTPVPAASPVKQRSAGSVFVMVLVALAVLGGGAFAVFKLTGKSSKMSNEKLQVLREEHANYIKSARELAEQGKFNSAGVRLDLAHDKSVEIGDPSLNELENATQQFIATSKKTRKEQFDAKMKHFDELAQGQELDKEPGLIDDIKKLAWDDETVPPLIASREQALNDFNRMKEQEQRVEEAFTLARALTPDAALDSLKQVSELLDGNTLKNSKARPGLQKKLESVVAEMKEAKVAAEKQKIEEQKRAKFTELIASADRLVVGDLSMADDAEKKLAEADTMYAGDPAVAKEREKIKGMQADRKKRVEFDSILAEADRLIKANNLNQADSKLKEADKLFPDDPQITPYLQKIAGLREEADKLASAKEKRQHFDEYIKTVDDLLGKESLAEAESKLSSAEKLLPTEPALAPRKEKLGALKAERDRLQKLAALLSGVDDALAKNTDLDGAAAKLAEAKKLNEAPASDLAPHKLQPENTARITGLEKKIADQKAENAKRAQFDGFTKKADELLAASKLNDAAAQINEAAKLYADDPKIASLKQSLAAAQKAALEKERRDDFEKTVAGVVKIIEAGGNLNDAEQKLSNVDKSFRDDPMIIDARKKLTAKRDEMDRREKFRKLVADADDALNKGDANAAEAKINQAAGLFPSDPALQRVKDKLNAKKNKKDERVGEGGID